jgi:hypothetical protein
MSHMQFVYRASYLEGAEDEVGEDAGKPNGGLEVANWEGVFAGLDGFFLELLERAVCIEQV